MREKFLNRLCSFLAPEDPLSASDVIFVCAGRPERKPYGLQLFREGLAPRLILSVGRFEIREVKKLHLSDDGGFRDLVSQTPAASRHFFLDFRNGRPHASLQKLKRGSTFRELQALAEFLKLDAPSTLTLISTSIHLRRIKMCCHKIPFFREWQIFLRAVPEEISSFRRYEWWKRPYEREYLRMEYAKLLAYSILY